MVMCGCLQLLRLFFIFYVYIYMLYICVLYIIINISSEFCINKNSYNRSCFDLIGHFFESFRQTKDKNKTI